MDKVLSQEEINALFSAMSSEDASLGSTQEKAPAARKVVGYDFHRADRIPQDQLRSIHLLHEHFGRNFASSLSAYLRAFVEVNLVSLEQVSYSAFIKTLPDPTLFSSIGMPPMDGNLALELDPALVYPMIDMILGGPGHPQVGNRNLTDIELNIVEGVVKLAMKDLEVAWRPIIEFEFYLDSKGTKAQMFQIVSPAETVIAAHLELKIGENSGMMNLCIPARVLKLLRNKFDQQWSVKRPKAASPELERIFDLIKGIPISLSGEIRSSCLTVGDLLKISVGDVVQLNERVSDPVLLSIGGKAKFAGRIVSRRGKKAFEISEKYVA